MTTAGTIVAGGYYINRDAWDLVAVAGKEGILPGPAGDRYIKVPVWAVLALAPMAAGMFVAFVPMIGFVLVFRYLGRGLVSRGKKMLSRNGRSSKSSVDSSASADAKSQNVGE